MTYKYEQPAGKKYTVSIKEWNKVFAERGKWPLVKVEVYVQDNQAISHYVVSNTGKAIVLLLSPLLYIGGTISQGFPEAHKAFKDVMFNKSRGAFSSDVSYKKNKESWEKLMKLIEEHGK